PLPAGGRRRGAPGAGGPGDHRQGAAHPLSHPDGPARPREGAVVVAKLTNRNHNPTLAAGRWWHRPQLRSPAPNRWAASATTASRTPAVSAAVRVRSGARIRSENANDLRPSPSVSEE